GLLPARDSAAAGRAGLRLRDQGRLLELAPAQVHRRGVPALAARGRGRDGPRDRAGHPAVGRPPAARGPVPEACRPPDAEELPARPVHPRRWALRVLCGGDQPAARPVRPLGLRLWPGSTGEDLRRTQGRVRARRGSDEALRGQQRLAATEHPRPQPDPELPAGDLGRAEAAVPEAHLRLPFPQHAHAPVSCDRPRRASDPPRRPKRAPPYSHSRDGDLVWADRSPSGGLIYSPIGANGPLLPGSPGPERRRLRRDAGRRRAPAADLRRADEPPLQPLLSPAGRERRDVGHGPEGRAAVPARRALPGPLPELALLQPAGPDVRGVLRLPDDRDLPARRLTSARVTPRGRPSARGSTSRRPDRPPAARRGGRGPRPARTRAGARSPGPRGARTRPTGRRARRGAPPSPGSSSPRPVTPPA